MSSKKQDTSITEQRSGVVPFAAGKYHVLEDYVDEGKSGSKDTRKRVAFLRMIADVTTGKYKGKVRTILCYNFDRFGRLDTLAAAEHKRQLRDAGVKLDTPLDGLLDWSKSMDRIVDAVKSEAAHAVSLTIGEKGLRGRIRVTKLGRPNQTTPYAMSKQVTSPTGIVTVIPRTQRFATPKTWQSRFCPGDEQEVAAIRFLFETYDREDITFNRLAVRLRDKGFPSPTGQGWQGQYVSCLLQNVAYAGGLSIGKQRRGAFYVVQDGSEVVPKADASPGAPLIVWDKHEGIIDRELFERVQAKIRRNFVSRDCSKGKPGGRVGSYAFSGGLVCCGSCGKPMYGAKDGKGRNIYRCHRVEVDAVSNCGYWIAYEQDLFDFLFSRFLPDLHAAASQAEQRRQAVPDAEAERLRRRLAEVEKKLARANDNFLLAPPEVALGLLPRLKSLRDERAALARQLETTAGVQANETLLASLARRFRVGPEMFEALQRHIPNLSPLWTVADEQIVMIPAEAERLCIPQVALPLPVFREMLKGMGIKISVWFKRKPKGKGYDLAKWRGEATGGLVCDEYASNAAS
jgi:DNA invertase Pin-like site-specific DNA recombinase